MNCALVYYNYIGAYDKENYHKDGDWSRIYECNDIKDVLRRFWNDTGANDDKRYFHKKDYKITNVQIMSFEESQKIVDQWYYEQGQGKHPCFYEEEEILA